MVRAAKAWLAEPSTVRRRSVAHHLPPDVLRVDGATDLVLHADRPRWPDPPPAEPGAAEPGHAAGRQRALVRRARGRLAGARDGERARPARGVRRPLGTRARPRPAAVLPAGLRHAGEGPWGWRFGGHHVSLNYTLDGDRLVSSTPDFLGSDPARVLLPGAEQVEILGGHAATARRLMASLSDSQRTLRDRAPGGDLRHRHRQPAAGDGPGDEMIHMQDLWRGRFADPALEEARRRRRPPGRGRLGVRPARPRPARDPHARRPDSARPT